MPDDKKKKNTEGRDEKGRFTKGHRIGENTRFERENAAACKYHERYADELIEYFDQPPTRVEYKETFNKDGVLIKRTPVVIPNDYPTFESFAARHNVTTQTLLNWCEQSPRFCAFYARAKEMQKVRLIENSLRGMYNPMFAKMLAMTDHGMTEKTTNDSTVTYSIKLPDEIDEESD